MNEFGETLVFAEDDDNPCKGNSQIEEEFSTFCALSSDTQREDVDVDRLVVQ